jgi:hypothetical protein
VKDAARRFLFGEPEVRIGVLGKRPSRSLSSPAAVLRLDNSNVRPRTAHALFAARLVSSVSSQ